MAVHAHMRRRQRLQPFPSMQAVCIGHVSCRVAAGPSQADAKPAAAAAAAAPPAEAPAKAEKPKNPLDTLPPSKMVGTNHPLWRLVSGFAQAANVRCSPRPQDGTYMLWDVPPHRPHLATALQSTAQSPRCVLSSDHGDPQILDSWKRLYSNTPAAKFREICIAGLWNGADVPNSPTQEHFEGFDPEVCAAPLARQLCSGICCYMLTRSDT